MTALDRIDAALNELPQEIRSRSGSVFYAGRDAFEWPSRLYVLGLNPGGSPALQSEETVDLDIRRWRSGRLKHSRYLDDSWRGKPAGRHGMQPRMRHMFDRLGVDLRQTPSSNVLFVRSPTEAAVAGEKFHLLQHCWPIHDVVIEALHIDTILCLGRTPGLWVREVIGAHQTIDAYVETNARGWKSDAHLADDGRAVITVTHPGRADWRNPDADPTSMVARVLARRR